MHSVHIVRVESLVGAGIFDCCLCYNGVTVWMEGKYLLKFPLRSGTLVKTGFSDHQELFGIRRVLAGGVSFLWVHVGFNRDLGKKVGITIEDQDGMELGGTVTKGWYLIELCSADLIRKARGGFEQGFMGGFRFDSPKALSKGLLDRLDSLAGRG